MSRKILKDIRPPSHEEEEPIVLEPEYAIKEKLGKDVNIRELLSEEMLEQAQGVIHKKKGEFVEMIRQDLEKLHQLLESLEGSSWDAEVLKEFTHTVLQIKSRAGTFGYPLASEVARKLYVFCDESYRAKSDHVVVVRKHVEGLQAVFSMGIEGSGSNLGHELLNSLDKLAQKLR